VTPNPHVALQAALRQSFMAFTRKSFHTVNPGRIFDDNWHLEAIAHHLELCQTGKIKRLIITVPPRSLKSISTSVAFPAFLLGCDPTLRIFCISYAIDLALKHARDFRRVVESPWYPQVFPYTTANRITENDFETTRGGTRHTTSIGGTITGLGGNFIIIDDPLKPEEALSRSQREKVNDYFATTLYSRLDNATDDVIILVMQRLHDEDLAGQLLKQGGWHHLNLPAIAEEDQDVTIGEQRIHARKTGEVLHPERQSLEELEKTKRIIGTLNFRSQYQQAPVPEAGNLIKRDWFEFFDVQPSREAARVTQSWDVAMKGDEINDYCVCTTWLRLDGKHYLIDLVRRHCDYPALLRLALEQYRKHNPTAVLIEDNGSGTALIQELAQKYAIHAIPIHPKGDKITRLSIVSPRFEQRAIYLPRNAPWLSELLDELLRFPQTRFKDQVDSVSQYLIWDGNSGTDIFEVFWT
jgi:predicted phage terminase large subunit-like protein